MKSPQHHFKTQGGWVKKVHVHNIKLHDTVEPRLTDIPQQRTPAIYWTILKVPTILPFTSVLKQPRNNGHPATLHV